MEAPLAERTKQVEEEENKKMMCVKLKKVASMGAPMLVVSMSQYLLQVTSTMIVGRQSELSLAGISLGSSVANVIGFKVLFGLALALETLCGQSYGAKQYRKLGSYACTSMLCLLIICFPISLLSIFMKQIMILLHQDSQVSEIASVYLIWLIPGMFGYAVLQSLVRYLQSQRLIFPMILSSLTALCFHVPLCWVLVYKRGLGTKGAAISISLSYWLNLVFLWVFTKRSRACEETRIPMSNGALRHTKLFFRFAVPSAMMVCLESTAFEVLVLISGLLPNAKFETSVISMCLMISTLHYNLVDAIGAAASTNVANELGAGNPLGARASARVAVIIAATESVVISVALFFLRRIWGYAFSSVEEVIQYAAEITPILCISMVMDSFFIVLSGVMRGTGKQKIGACLSIASYYIVGIPVGLLLCFVLHFKAKGLWIGVLSGTTLQSLLLFLIIGFTDWTQEVIKARERMFEKTVDTHDSLVA